MSKPAAMVQHFVLIYTYHSLHDMLTVSDIFLFDKDRTLQSYRQSFEIDYTGARSFGILNSILILQDDARKPTTRLIEEHKEALISTFLTSSEAKSEPTPTDIRQGSSSRAYTPVFNSNTSNVPVPPKPTFENSTRQRFLKHISKQGILDRSNAENDVVILKVQLAFTSMIAEDWNLVLSQMCQTLDDIDRKMSDNNELRHNVLAWRRLLGSWRMTIIEYRAKLLETVQFLKSQVRQPVGGIGSVQSLGQESDHSNSVIPPIRNEIEELLRSYQILTDGIKEIETRVERSFHALMSSMSIIESQKAIVQGSAVARLTELAFIFIPLNFACTFFSMQITVCIISFSFSLANYLCTHQFQITDMTSRTSKAIRSQALVHFLHWHCR